MRIPIPKTRSSQAVSIGLLAAVIIMAGWAGYKIYHSQSHGSGLNTPLKSETARQEKSAGWVFNEQTKDWLVQDGQAPDCKEPFIFDNSPVDLSRIMVIGMPGAYRGFDYKAHGGMRLTDGAGSGDIDVRMPMDATLVSLKRYYEGDPAELQYLLEFISDCGIAFRFDHLYTLAPALQAVAEKTPLPKVNDTRSDPNFHLDPLPLRAGDLIATAVGFPATKNFGFDFGVYDYRSRNEISKDSEWAAIHARFISSEWYGRCWSGMLPGADAAKAKELSLVVVNPERPNLVSDYCDYAPQKTLEINGGRPTDG